MSTVKFVFFNFTLVLLLQNQCIGQIVVDKENIRTPSTVKIKNGSFEITEGIARGNNLFHSFKEFNIRSDEMVIFKNGEGNFNNLIIRVSGSRKSNLNGLLDSGGISNVVLINPLGINIKSGFIVKDISSLNLTTANSLSFSDKFILDSNSFINSSSQSSNIETISFNNNIGSIRIENVGDILESNIFEVPTNLSRDESSLSVDKLGRIFLSANNIFADGALVFAPKGDIFLHTKESGNIDFNNPVDSKELQGEIVLDNYSLIETQGEEKGSINLVSKNLNIVNGSSLLVDNFNNKNGSINIQTESFLLEGITDIENISDVNTDNPVFSPLRTRSTVTVVNTPGPRKSKIKIQTTHARILNGGRIANIQGGIEFDSKKIDLINGNNINPKIENNILADTFSPVNGGNIDINTQDLQVTQGSNISTTTFSSGNAGDLNIFAYEIVVGSDLQKNLLDIISSSSFSFGKTGDIKINSNKVKINTAGFIGNSSIGSADTGNVNINSNQISILNNSKTKTFNTGITSFVFPEANEVGEAERFNIASLNNLKGKAGNINLNTNNLILESGLLTVQNFGLGEGGEVNIDAHKLLLNDSVIALSTSNGDAGNLNIKSEFVSLSNSFLTSRTNTFGIGGSINIESTYFATKGETGIIADSNNDQAGKININSKAANISPRTILSATSGLGPQLDGNILINSGQTAISKLSEINVHTPSALSIGTNCDRKDSVAHNHGPGIVHSNLSDRQKKALPELPW